MDPEYSENSWIITIAVLALIAVVATSIIWHLLLKPLIDSQL